MSSPPLAFNVSLAAIAVVKIVAAPVAPSVVLSTREKLREFFEIDANHIAYNALLACNLLEDAQKFKAKYQVKINSSNPYMR